MIMPAKTTKRHVAAPATAAQIERTVGLTKGDRAKIARVLEATRANRRKTASGGQPRRRSVSVSP